MTAAPVKLAVSGLNAAYGQARVLFDVALNVAAGEAVALIGRNGAGKSTTLRAILGLIRNRSGAVVFDGENVSALATYDIVRRGLGYVPEDRRIFSDLTALENLAVGRQAPRAGAPTWTLERLFAIFPNLRELRDRVGARMSGGEQQMLAIARALMARPKMLLLDEPSLGLAPIIVSRIFDIIRDINRISTTILLVEQNANMALHVAHRGYVLQTGQIVLADTAQNLMHNEQVKKSYLGG
jgi:branched-chain amino acid transport system ATP-binding protein